MSHQVGFLGAGKMATALACGLIRSEFTFAENVFASDVSEDARSAFEDATGAKAFPSSNEVMEHAQIIFLAVKPQVIDSVLAEIASMTTPDHLIVSIAAGVTLNQIESPLGDRRVIRVMPNTPAIVGAGASGYTKGTHATDTDAALVKEMLSTVGIAIEVPEKLLDAVTGLSGSGPAYVFEIIEALSDGGVLAGLPRATATQLAAQTLMGAAKMVLETGQHPGELKDAVTSPGGTTIAGLHELEERGVRGALMSAVQAAAARSKELGEE